MSNIVTSMNELNEVLSLCAAGLPLAVRLTHMRYYHHDQVANQEGDPEVLQLWVPLTSPAHAGHPAWSSAGRPVLPGSTSDAELKGPYVRLALRFCSSSDMELRSGELGLTPLHWYASSAGCEGAGCVCFGL